VSGFTVRERLVRARAFLKRLDGAVLTTFNLHAPFLEDNVLPALLDVHASTPAARRAEVHEKLGEAPVSVFYDPSTPPRISGAYRYSARPVPVRGRFFHPKLIIIGGRDEHGVPWVWLAVMSANLTLSGWGRNAECFGETWLHTRKQQPWLALRRFLEWLDGHAPLGEGRSSFDAIDRVIKVLDAMPDRRRFDDDGSHVWSGTQYANAYFSHVHEQGFAHFLRRGRARPPSRAHIYSPYWADVSERVASFGARETYLVPALLPRDPPSIGLTEDDLAGLPGGAAMYRNPGDRGQRFWHAKVYWVAFGRTEFVAVGSCNFTQAGLAGMHGNVEAMLIDGPSGDFLDPLEDYDDPPLLQDPVAEEEAPEPSPLCIVVAYDWRARCYRWWYEPSAGHADVRLVLPTASVAELRPGTDETPGAPPPRGARYEVRWIENGEKCLFRGCLVELHLDHSTRAYGRKLSAAEILASWKGRSLAWDLGGGGGGPGEGEGDAAAEDEVDAAFDAVNLYEMYRAFRDLGRKLDRVASDDVAVRGLLVGRPGSAFRLGAMAAEGRIVPVVRYLVLNEVETLFERHCSALEPEHLLRVTRWRAEAREAVVQMLQTELPEGSPAVEPLLTWFDERLAVVWGDR
jgi:hypothetical protein